jgi:hypothetical protein
MNKSDESDASKKGIKIFNMREKRELIFFPIYVIR